MPSIILYQANLHSLPIILSLSVLFFSSFLQNCLVNSFGQDKLILFFSKHSQKYYFRIISFTPKNLKIRPNQHWDKTAFTVKYKHKVHCNKAAPPFYCTIPDTRPILIKLTSFTKIIQNNYQFTTQKLTKKGQKNAT